MNRLEEYYRLFDLFNGNLTDKQKEVLGELEDQIIAEEILPAISESVAPVLSTLRRNLTLIVDYDTDKGITVKTTRGEVVVKEHTAKRYEIPATKKVVTVAEADLTAVNSEEEFGITRSESVGFSVTFRDGSVIVRKDAQSTMIATLRAIGFERVAPFRGRTFAGYPLVGREKRTDGAGRWQQLVDGWYIYTNMSNDVKMRVLRMISDELDLGLIIKNERGEIVKFDSNDPSVRKRIKFSFNGLEPMTKRHIVHTAIKTYLDTHPNTTYEKLKAVFPKELQGAYGVFARMSWIEAQHTNGHDHMNRYFTSPTQLLTTADGILIAVCNQWGDNFHKFVDRVKELGWDIKEII